MHDHKDPNKSSSMDSVMVEIPSLTPTPNIMKCKRLLAIQAHYDDVDIAIGGLVAKLAANGAEILYATVTDDLAGLVNLTITREAAHSELTRESSEAAKIIGSLGVINLNYPDAGNWTVHEASRDLLAVIRQFQPDCILALDPWLSTEAHSDHYKTGFAAVEALILSDVLGVESSQFKIPEEFRAQKNSNIYAVGLYNSTHANIFIDIEDVLQKKLQAVSRYVSQFSPESMTRLLIGLSNRSEHIASLGKKASKLEEGVIYAECLKVFSPDALHAAR
jgi:LmbE family N-acetylglucosaminyl deacetylase